MIAMQLLGLHLEPASRDLFMLLREAEEPKRALPIFIGAVEAEAIIRGAQGLEAPRPLTHDLLASVIVAVGGRLEAVVISALVDGAFHAELQLVGRAGPVTVSARPSDGVALAVRAGAPIFAAEGVLEQAGFVLRPGAPEPAPHIEEAVEDFRTYLETLEPADFLVADRPEGPPPSPSGPPVDESSRPDPPAGPPDAPAPESED